MRYYDSDSCDFIRGFSLFDEFGVGMPRFYLTMSAASGIYSQTMQHLKEFAMEVSKSAPLLFILVLYVFIRLSMKKTLEGVADILPTAIESVNLNCEPVFTGSRGAIKYKYWTYNFDRIEKELYESEDVCSTINKYFFFENQSLSLEEESYPLSYGLVVYKDIVQVLLELSIFYQPQNAYCITVDQGSSRIYKNFVQKLPSCFPNIMTFIGEKSLWGSYGILHNVHKCFEFLVEIKHPWQYYQYLSGTDLPLRTNLEVVRIMKALNGSINTDIEQFEQDRYRMMEGIHPPVPLYKSAMSVAIPRRAANFMLRSTRVKKLLEYLSHTWIPDESFWTSVAGNAVLLRVPGSYRARDILWLRKHLHMVPPLEQSINNVGTSYIGRYQVWERENRCYGRITSWSCVFGVLDIPTLLNRPELIVHKMYLDTEPAAFMCLLKELRRRSRNPIDFDARSYAEMPTVELSNGKRITELTHPEWLMRSSFHKFY
ncbi:hypothetical protein RB195_025717 [Necator americanus]|uniref:Core-2/I-Branching enzyme n=1 Tax=Necator americanus TaxID=51031 RepID=A0ABR1ETN2_NECAM